MAKTVIVCGKLFDGLSDTIRGPAEILIEDADIAEVSNSVGRPDGAKVVDLSDRTVSPGFIDTHVHLCIDGLNLARQTLQCSPAKALAGRDMGTLDPEWPTINLRDAIDSGIARGPRIIVAPHMISATAGHGDMQGMFPCRCHMGLSRVAGSPAGNSARGPHEHAVGADRSKTHNTRG